MRIGILSDTHGSLKNFAEALAVLGDCEMILHGGDVLYHGPRNPLPEDYSPKDLAEQINGMKNILFVRGNCDADVDQMVIKHPLQSPYLLCQLGKYKILISHGYTRDRKDYIQMARDFNANIFIYGHTHIKELSREENLIVINPGSTSLPKDGVRSVAVIEDNLIQLINVENKQVIKELKLD